MDLINKVSGACITGQVRTFFLACVSGSIRDNLLIPLNLRTHVFIHGKNISNEKIRVALKGANLITVVALPPQTPKVSCPTIGNGYALTPALFACYEAIQRDGKPYDWVVRLRSDHTIPFRITALPDASVYYATHSWATGVVLSASLGSCNCGWKKRRCESVRRVFCKWSDDQFAFLHGYAIRSYLHELNVRFCDYKFLGFDSFNDLKTSVSERRLALLLRNSTVHDLRFISSVMHPRLQRSGTCGKPDDGREPAYLPTVLDVPYRSFYKPLPSGPWDQRRLSVCTQQRLVKKQSLCFSYDKKWDDQVFYNDVMRMLH